MTLIIFPVTAFPSIFSLKSPPRLSWRCRKPFQLHCCTQDFFLQKERFRCRWCGSLSYLWMSAREYKPAVRCYRKFVNFWPIRINHSTSEKYKKRLLVLVIYRVLQLCIMMCEKWITTDCVSVPCTCYREFFFHCTCSNIRPGGSCNQRRW